MLLALALAAAASAALPGAPLPGACARFQVTITQSADAGLLGTQTERYAVTGALDGGAWRDVAFSVVQDDDPEHPLWSEGDYPFPLGGAHTRGAEDVGAPVVAESRGGWRYTWQREDLTYSVLLPPEGGRVRRQTFRLPGKVSEGDGWAKNIAWTMQHDTDGWPQQEDLTLRVGKGLFGADLTYRLVYARTGDCGSGE